MTPEPEDALDMDALHSLYEKRRGVLAVAVTDSKSDDLFGEMPIGGPEADEEERAKADIERMLHQEDFQADGRACGRWLRESEFIVDHVVKLRAFAGADTRSVWSHGPLGTCKRSESPTGSRWIPAESCGVSCARTGG